MFQTYQRWSKKGYILFACAPLNLMMALLLSSINKDAALLYTLMTVFCLTAGYYFYTKDGENG